MARGEVRLPGAGLFIGRNLLVPDFCLLDEVGSSCLHGLCARPIVIDVHGACGAAAARLLRLTLLLWCTTGQALPTLRRAQDFSIGGSGAETLLAAPLKRYALQEPLFLVCG